MTSRDRVRAAMDHHALERAPRGEILVEEGFLDRVYAEQAGAPWREKMLRLTEEAQLDLVVIPFGPDAGEPELRELEWWAANTSKFVVALIDGLFWQPSDPLPFEEFVLGLKRDTGGIRALIEAKRSRALDRIGRCLSSGADGCLVGDDIAYDRGPFLAPDDLERWIFPGHEDLAQEIRAGGGTSLLHSCGNLASLLPRLTCLGFQGLHGLSACAGNDLAASLEQARGRMALMGGADVDAWEPQEVWRFRERALCRSTPVTGYVLGSSSGLSRNTPLGCFRALYGV